MPTDEWDETPEPRVGLICMWCRATEREMPCEAAPHGYHVLIDGDALLDETPEVAGGEREALDLAEITRRLGAADEVVSALCEGKQRWTMSIPADIERDPDIVIARALHDARRMLALLSARPAPEREPEWMADAREAIEEARKDGDGPPCICDGDNVALQVLCRAFDDDPADLIEEWRAFDKSGWFWWGRALGVFIRTKIEALRSRPEPVSEPTEGWRFPEMMTLPVSEPEPAPGAEPVEPVAWRYKWDGEDRWFLADRIDAVPLAIRHDMRTMDADIRGRMEALVPLASPPSERAGERELLREAADAIHGLLETHTLEAHGKMKPVMRDGWLDARARAVKARDSLRALAASPAPSDQAEPKLVYAKRLNGAQRRALNEFARLTGWEPIGQEDYDAGRTTFAELWWMNVRLLEHTAADVQNIDLRGCGDMSAPAPSGGETQ